MIGKFARWRRLEEKEVVDDVEEEGSLDLCHS